MALATLVTAGGARGKCQEKLISLSRHLPQGRSWLGFSSVGSQVVSPHC